MCVVRKQSKPYPRLMMTTTAIRTKLFIDFLLLARSLSRQLSKYDTHMLSHKNNNEWKQYFLIELIRKSEVDRGQSMKWCMA